MLIAKYHGVRKLNLIKNNKKTVNMYHSKIDSHR